MKRVLLSLWLALLLTPLNAKEAVPVAQDPALEARLNRLAKELRCLVCQNESLADSQADLAADLRREIREMMRQGKSDAEITRYLTDRYGDFVLYRPPLKSTTWLLWFGPFLLAGLAIAGFLYFLARRRKSLPDAPLSPEEQARVEALLGQRPEEPRS
ncbi:cytochrome c-type biogenesis protein [Thiobacter aerophilum]|uniref:Cytochrome c-type biogenesis protein n=1 Tax=Thiobacter aerophilum TaxID=3121275 RepID=A0ABV0EES9_9BURK